MVKKSVSLISYNMQKLFLISLLITFSIYPIAWPWRAKLQPSPKVISITITNPLETVKVAKQLYEATKRKDVNGVILLVDSDGGSVSYFSVIHDMVKKLASIKPVISLVTGSANSGGYMVASAANIIIAHSFSYVGSIGAKRTLSRYTNARAKNTQTKDYSVEADLKVNILVAGEYKNPGDPYAPELTKDQMAFEMGMLMKTYNSFITLVAQNRHLKKEDYKIWAEGKCFNAPEALELGLIDSIGTIFDAEKKMAELIAEHNPNLGPNANIDFVY